MISRQDRFNGLRTFCLIFLFLHNPIQYTVYAGPVSSSNRLTDHSQVRRRDVKRSVERTGEVTLHERAGQHKDKKWISAAIRAGKLLAFAADTFCYLIIFMDFGCWGLQKTICELKNELKSERAKLDHQVDLGEYTRGNFTEISRLVNEVEERNNKLVKDISFAVDMVNKYLVLIEKMKSNNLYIPNVPDGLLVMDYATRKRIIDLDKMLITQTGTTKEVLIVALVFMGLEMLMWSFGRARSRGYFGGTALPKDTNWDFTMKKNGKLYGVKHNANGPQIFRLKNDLKAKRVADYTELMTKKKPPVYKGTYGAIKGKAVNVAGKLKANIGRGIMVGLRLLGWALCAWQTAEIFKKNAEAERQLREKISEVKDITSSVIKDRLNLTTYLDELKEIAGAHMGNFDLLVHVLVDSQAFERAMATRPTAKQNMLNVAAVNSTLTSVTQRQATTDTFMNTYINDLKGEYDQLRFDVQLTLLLKNQSPVSSMIASLANQQLGDYTEYDIFVRIAQISQRTKYDGVTLSCIKNGQINSQASLDAYRQRLQAQSNAGPAQNIVTDVETLAGISNMVGTIIRVVKNKHGVTLTERQVLEIITQMPEYANEPVYPKPAFYPDYPDYQVTYPKTWELAPYRQGADTC